MSTTPATTATHGPFRAVVGTEWSYWPRSDHWAWHERLACGHQGPVHHAEPWHHPEPTAERKATVERAKGYLVRKRRRCTSCR